MKYIINRTALIALINKWYREFEGMANDKSAIGALLDMLVSAEREYIGGE